MRYNFGELITAMVTPFNKDLSIDYNSFKNLIEHLINTGSDAILLAGTTGETPTLTHEEEDKMFDFVKDTVKGRVKLIMGAGSNSTHTAVQSSINAQKAGADAILTVVPYYNKPSQKGIYNHFSEIAKSVDIPIILYNIPSRTGVDMQPVTISKLAAEFKNIAAIKQSNSNLDLITEIRKSTPDDFLIFSGDDSLTLPMLSLGATGVISVASHIAGGKIKQMITYFKSGEIEKALDLHLELYPLFKKLFMAPNPVPVKAALAYFGLINDYVRMPLVMLDEAEKAQLLSVVENYKCMSK